MEVQGIDPLRRTTRSALAEIPMRLGLLRVSPLTPPATPTVATRNTHLTPTTMNNSARSLTPVLSPDELVIQQRGRRRVPVTWSPDNFKKTSSPFGNRTPQKSPSKNNIASLRTTPRKRLMLSEHIEVTPEKKYLQLSPNKRSPIKHSPLIKRAKLDLTPAKPVDNIDAALKGLSSDQLIGLIKVLVEKHPQIEKDLKQNIPTPDIKYMEDKLNYLKRNIFKSIPSCRLTSKTDSQAFSRASTHLSAFKKCLIDQCKVLYEGQHWDTLVDYVILAWSYVRATPSWDNHAHNATRRVCFKNLTSHCLQALKYGDFSNDRYSLLYERFRCMSMDCEDVLNCLKLLESKIACIK